MTLNLTRTVSRALVPDCADSEEPGYWRQPPTTEMMQASLAALICSVISLCAGFIVVGVYVFAMRRPGSVLSTMVTPHNHFIVLAMCCSLFSSMTFIITSALRLVGDQYHSYVWCDTSLLITQIFVPTQTMLEGLFLLALVVSTFRRDWMTYSTSVNASSFVFYGSCGSILISTASAFGLMHGILRNPEWGTRGDPELLPWCVIPSTETGYIVAQFFTDWLWKLLIPLVGVSCIVVVKQKLKVCSSGTWWFIVTRIVYTVAYTALSIAVLVARLTASGNLLPQAIIDSLLPTITALIFLISEAAPRWLWGDSQNDSDDAQRLGNPYGVAGFLWLLEVSVASKTQVEAATADGVLVEFDKGQDAWNIVFVQSKEPATKEAGAAKAIVSVQTVKFAKLDRWQLTGYMAFMCGFGDATGFLMVDFFTAHITGDMANVAMALGGFPNQHPMRHGVGFIVFFVGLCVGSEITRRASNKTTGARSLLILQGLCLISAYVVARMHDEIGSCAWQQSPVSYISTYLIKFGFALTNIFMRLYLPGLPIPIGMTGNTTAMTAELVKLPFQPDLTPEAKKKILCSVRNATLNICAFFLGIMCCGYLYKTDTFKDSSFAVTAMLGMINLWIGWASVQE